MGAFQIVYDDFSGGQYMGPRPADQPKNTWHGLDVLATPTGELIPGGTRLAAQHSVAESGGTILDHWIFEQYGYVFVSFTAASKMIRYDHSNGTLFPVGTTSWTLLGTPIGNDVAYSSVTNRFYYPSFVALGTTQFYRISPTGTSNTTMTGSVDRTINGVKSYKLRLVAWGGNRIYYTGAWSGADFGSWSSANYYEFDSLVLQVYPRTDDLLVICEQGVYSLTGVLGSGVTIQLLSPGPNVSPGMAYGEVVNRSLFYLDAAGTVTLGTLDGRLYQHLGARSSAVGVFQQGDYGYTTNGYVTYEPGRVGALANGRVLAQFKNGYAYFESSPGVFSRSRVHSLDLARTTANQYKPPKIGPNAPNEYTTLAVRNSAISGQIAVYRTFTNIPEPTYLDANFSYSTSSTTTVLPTGTVELAEYWHQKPFTVKEMFIEYSVNTSGQISAYVEPTGVVDVGPTNLSGSVSNTATDTGQTAGSYRMFRYWPNSASKGFGMKPILTLTNCTVKRVIVNCED